MTAATGSTESPERSGHTLNGLRVGRALVWSRGPTQDDPASAELGGGHAEVRQAGRRAMEERRAGRGQSTLEDPRNKVTGPLRQQRRVLETSMLAYSQRMRKISMERLAISNEDPTPPASQGSALVERLNMASSSLDDRLRSEHWLHAKSDRKGRPVRGGQAANECPTSPSAVDKDPRVSSDSGIDTEEDLRWGRLSDMKNVGKTYLNTSRLPAQSSKRGRTRPASFHEFGTNFVDHNEVTHDEMKKKLSVDSALNGSMASRGSRQRRPATIEKPDIAALQANIPLNQEYLPGIRLDLGTHSLDVTSESVSITPFPESVCLSPAVNESDLRSMPSSRSPAALHLLVDSPQGITNVSRTPRAQQKFSLNTRENYWSFRKAQQRFSIKPEKAHVSVVTRPKPVRIKKYKPPPPPPKKTYFSSFRYSEAVENVLRSFDDQGSSPNKASSALRKASQVLPSLDFEDLKQERQRLKAENKRNACRGARDDGEHGSNGADLVHAKARLFRIPIARERSFSAPSILSNATTSARVQFDEVQVYVKPPLRKFHSTYFSDDLLHKAVKFCLPTGGVAAAD